jgi:hypothetical protein
MNTAQPPQVRFTITPDVVLDARRAWLPGLYAGYRIVMGVVVLIGLVLGTIGGDWSVGLPVVLFGLLMLLWTWFRGFDRWLMRTQSRGIIGGTMAYALDDAGIHYSNPMSGGLIRWSGLTRVRATDKVIALGRDRVLVAYVPTSAFRSAADREAFLAFARAHVGSSAAN